MIPLAVIVVVAVIAALALAASAVLAVKLHAGRRQSATDSYGADDDLEKVAEAPTRKVQIHRGRVVSWHSSAASVARSMRSFSRIPTPKLFSSRPSSTASLPRTIDLENEIAQFRRNYARAKELEAENPGGGDVNGLIPVSRLETPRPATVRPAHVLSAIDESEDPADLLKESSWETYNGHRQSNHPLSSSLAPFSPSLEHAVETEDIEAALASVRPPAPTKAKSSDILRSSKLYSAETSASANPGLRRTQTEGKLPSDAVKRPLQLNLDTLNLDSVLAARPPPTGGTTDIISPTAPSIQSAIYKSPVQEIVPAAPQPRKPSKLDLRGSFSKLDYGFPSPPASSSVFSSPTRTSMITFSTDKATFGDEDAMPVPDRRSTISEQLRHGDFMDLESVTTRSRSRGSSRATSRSRNSRSRSSTHRVRKRPPPLTIEAVPPLPGREGKTLAEDKPLDTDAYLASPTASDAASIKSNARRKSLRASIASNYSALSPSFAVTSVFRMPLYAGKGQTGAKLKTISKKSIAAALAAESGEIERRGSEGDALRKSKQQVHEQERPGTLRAFSQTAADMEPPEWSADELQTILRQAHDMAGSTEPITPVRSSPVPVATSSSKPTTKSQPPRNKSIAHLHIRPILKNRRTASHNPESPTAPKKQRPSSHLSRSVSANVVSSQAARSGSMDEKALPPLPPPPTPPGVQRVAIQSLRVADPDDEPNATAEAIKSATTKAASTATGAETLLSPPTANSLLLPPNAAPKPSRRRSGLDRIAGAVIQEKPPLNTAISAPSVPIVTATEKRTVTAPQLPELVPVSKLAFGPTVTSREVFSPSSGSGSISSASRSNSGSIDGLVIDRGVEGLTIERGVEGGLKVDTAVTIEKGKENSEKSNKDGGTESTSPAVSSVSNTPDNYVFSALPRKRLPIGRALITNRIWDERSAVSPLSTDFPVGVKV